MLTIEPFFFETRQLFEKSPEILSVFTTLFVTADRGSNAEAVHVHGSSTHVTCFHIFSSPALVGKPTKHSLNKKLLTVTA